jgi:hypothetical protein
MFHVIQMKMPKSIASSLKDNRRLATFSIEKPEEFLAYLKTRYDSELRNWYLICSRDDWKYLLIVQELKIRAYAKRIKELEAFAETW